MELYHEEVRQIRSAIVSSASKTIYEGCAVKLLRWFFCNQSQLLTRPFMDHMTSLSESTSREIDSAIKQWLGRAPENPPLVFAEINVAHFLTFIVSLRKADGTKPGFSTYNSHRAAFKHIFRLYEVTQDAVLERELE